MDPPVDLTSGQKNALMITERVVSIFSILGIFFILVTFYFLSSFNKPINRLVFYASFGNLGMNIACLISEDGINAGPLSPLCQFQAFLIQMCGVLQNQFYVCDSVADSGITGSWVSMHSGPAAWHGTSIWLSSTNTPTASFAPLTSGISWVATAPRLCLLLLSSSCRPRDAGKFMVLLG